MEEYKVKEYYEAKAKYETDETFCWFVNQVLNYIEQKRITVEQKRITLDDFELAIYLIRDWARRD